ncbi:GMC family oxidoreductase N-terminal domain-containing protein [Frankia sp. CNm7]|uniref:long-chain-alcohol oxidase n=1 Tax=Frankia nepalensis TaxID=1836974 RepID=A0A937URL6_9ACTN|nr:GMC family oxidoreductase N-terminal domain-containing protein [Frankia nepalensis]MBL7500633.1 GMC family oxidoreductase N-terminal domain-containing protein [Frankia nepalensis]MBL7511406.1 GMC family oxidoreductase N-terminal domain-containing protein [Frankia nepalensis]MBL7521761.1 GMC family oxidoreductase N-terminal domain-containing protein [Frankia nepalensis]MBL7631502.1 GMC family oxidoreductase N-terminal domain-containing protein [Frankia nepalensis]
MTLKPQQLAALAAICDTFAPGDGADIPSASALGAVDIAAAMAAGLPRAADRRQLSTLLSLWDTRLMGLLLGAGPKRFSSLGPTAREDALLRLGASSSAQKRVIFQALRGLATSSYFAAPGPTGSSPVWEAIGYPGPLGVLPDAPRPPLAPLTPTSDTAYDCDVVIVGSGAGGGTAAGVLAAAGLDVVVLERGGYYDDADFDGGELSGLSRLYAAGPATTAEGQVALVAGSCLGGGTVVNWTTSFPTPPRIRAEWAALGAGQFDQREFSDALDAVSRRLSVNADHSVASARDVVMERGLAALGWHVDAMPRNVTNCDMGTDCGRCGYGCRLGAKQSVTKTWLADAEAHGARLVVNVDVRRVDVRGGHAVGVQGTTRDGHAVTVRARAVVVAAGAIQTPALLRRSGLSNPNIGRYLRLHPATAVWGVYDEKVRPWEGGLQTRYSREHSDLDGAGYGVIYETGPGNPAALQGFLNWRGGAAHLATMKDLVHTGGVGIITRDRDSGEVRVGRDGEPVPRYRLSDHDAAHLRAGVEGATRIIEAAGARRIYSAHQAGPSYEPGRRGSYEEFVAACHSAGYGPGQCAIAALHLMGTARMGGSKDMSATDPDGTTWEVPNVVVVDASCFPTSSGVNPMISIEAIAYMNARRLAARLT